MALGIHKPGQGYWVRVLTATGIGIITLATAAWVWNQMALVADALPTNSYAMTLATSPANAPPLGETLVLLAKPETVGAAAPEIGTAIVSGYTPEANELRVSTVVVTDSAREIRDARGVRGASVQAQLQAGSVNAIPPVQKGILQGIGASVVLLLGAVLAYWVCAVRPSSGDFLIATDMEMKKVNWSNWKDIRAQTFVVVGACLLIAGFLFVVDFGLQMFFRGIDIIRTS